MIQDADDTFFGAIQAVGEKLPFSFAKDTNCAESKEFDYDFLVDGNYILTSLNVVKTVSDVGDNLLTVGIYSVSPGSNSTATESILAQAYFPSGTKCGVIAVAGDSHATPGFPAVAGTQTTSMLYSDGNITDPALAFINSIPSSGPSRQRIRIKIKAVVEGASFNPSCLVIAEFITVASTYTNSGTELTSVRVRW